MDINEIRSKLTYACEHPKCKRCGKELYIPRPEEKTFTSWGIYGWTAFVKQYAKHHGWYELKNLNRNLVCSECLLQSDIPDTIMLENYGEWERKYNEWRETGKR